MSVPTKIQFVLEDGSTVEVDQSDIASMDAPVSPSGFDQDGFVTFRQEQTIVTLRDGRKLWLRHCIEP
jgi:hypothetical protein